MLKLNKENRFNYVSSLDAETQTQIKKAITKALTELEENTEENIDNAMDSKVVDLEETIQIKYI